MSELFPHFPDLEEDAVNAIYDLCEDPESQVCYNLFSMEFTLRYPRFV